MKLFPSQFWPAKDVPTRSEKLPFIASVILHKTTANFQRNLIYLFLFAFNKF